MPSAPYSPTLKAAAPNVKVGTGQAPHGTQSATTEVRPNPWGYGGFFPRGKPLISS